MAALAGRRYTTYLITDYVLQCYLTYTVFIKMFCILLKYTLLAAM